MMVIVVDPMDDELGLGYAGRIAFINGISGFLSLRRLTLGCTQHPPNQNGFKQQFQFFADHLAISHDEYLQRHSMLPFHYAYQAAHDNSQSYLPLIACWLKPADGPILTHARCCPSCINEDVKTDGYAWWRRQHQLPGVDMCLTHGHSLWWMEGKEGFLRTPNVHWEAGRLKREQAPSIQHPSVLRYQQFADWLLKQPHRITPSALRRSIKERCSELDIRREVRNKSQQSSLSLLVRSVMPADWLRKHYPALLSKSYQGRELGIDAAFFLKGTSGMVISMVLASLFEDAEHFQHYLQQDYDSVEANPTKSRAAFVRLFLEHNGEITRIAQALGYALRSTYNIRERFGLPAIAGSTPQQRQVAFQKLRQASSSELENWGEAMKTYKKSLKGAYCPEHDWEVFMAIIHGRDHLGMQSPLHLLGPSRGSTALFSEC